MGRSAAKKTVVAAKKTAMDPAKTPRKKHKYRAGTVALRKIRKYQKSTETLMAKAEINRVVRHLASKHSQISLRFKKKAIDAIHIAGESYLINCAAKSQENACFNGRVTIKLGEMSLVNGRVQV